MVSYCIQTIFIFFVFYGFQYSTASWAGFDQLRNQWNIDRRVIKTLVKGMDEQHSHGGKSNKKKKHRPATNKFSPIEIPNEDRFTYAMSWLEKSQPGNGPIEMHYNRHQSSTNEEMSFSSGWGEPKSQKHSHSTTSKGKAETNSRPKDVGNVKNNNLPEQGQEDPTEHPPSDDVFRMVEQHATLIKQKANLDVETEQDKIELAAAPVDALAYVNYTEDNSQIFLVKVIIGNTFIVHIKIVVERDRKGELLFAKSALVAGLTDKDEADLVTKEEFE